MYVDPCVEKKYRPVVRVLASENVSLYAFASIFTLAAGLLILAANGMPPAYLLLCFLPSVLAIISSVVRKKYTTSESCFFITGASRAYEECLSSSNGDVAKPLYEVVYRHARMKLHPFEWADCCADRESLIKEIATKGRSANNDDIEFARLYLDARKEFERHGS